MYEEVELAPEDAVLAADVDGGEVDPKLLGQHFGYLVEHADVVDARDLERYGELLVLVDIPLGGYYPVAETALETHGDFALPLVDAHDAVVIDESQYGVAGDGSAAVADDIGLIELVTREQHRLLLINRLGLLRVAFLVLAARDE